MKKIQVLATALAAAAFLAGCGGNDAGDQTPRVKFTQMVNFGDSLSDVGTYKTQIVAANGGGHYSINGDFSAQGLAYTNWTEFLAAQLQVTQPCAAEVGLASVGALSFLAQTTVDSTTCTSYAQGGAEVTNPYGPGNAYLYTHYGSSSGQLGQLTKPVHDQIATYLSQHTSFNDGQIITVLAGGNDLFIDRALIVDAQTQATLQAVQAGQLTQAQAATMIAGYATQAVQAMTLAGQQLATLVTGSSTVPGIINNGGTHVVVVNLPNVSLTPDNAEWVAAGAGVYVEPIHPHLTLDMTNAFNTALAAGLSVTANTDQSAHPAAYGLTNVDTPACKMDGTAGSTGLTVPTSATTTTFVPLASSLFCTANTLISTDTASLMHYEFADTVHPTPYAYRLLAELVGEQMAIKGWL